MLARHSWASGPEAPETCALLISASRASRTSTSARIPERRSQFMSVPPAFQSQAADRPVSTCSTPARPWWTKLELRSGPVHRSARLAQATAPQSPPSVRQGHFGTWPVWQGHRRDGSIVKPGHTRNMALGCSTITPTGYTRPRLSTERRKRRLRFLDEKR